MENTRQNTKKITQVSMLLALVITLQALELFLPPLPGLPPGVKLGLSNITIMYALFFMNKSEALLLVLLKSLFALLTRGTYAALFSFSGGLFALLTMIILIYIFNDKISLLMKSIAGAIAHNLAQLTIASLLVNSLLVFSYLPVLIISGIFMGTITATLLRVTLPLFRRLEQ